MDFSRLIIYLNLIFKLLFFLCYIVFVFFIIRIYLVKVFYKKFLEGKIILIFGFIFYVVEFLKRENKYLVIFLFLLLYIFIND